MLLGGINASGGLLQRRLTCPTLRCWCCRACIFVVILCVRDASTAASASSGRGSRQRAMHGERQRTRPGWVRAAVAVSAARIRVEHAVPVRQPRRVHHREARPRQPRPRRHPGHGRDERLRAACVSARARPGSACWRRAPPARCWGCCTPSICNLPRVNDIAVGIALMLFGTGLAFFLGKPLIEPSAPNLPVDRLRLVERHPAGARRAAGSTCCSSSAWCWRRSSSGRSPTRAGA